MNTPNKLTVARIAVTPLFLFFLLASFSHHWLIAALVFIAASVTDAIDGRLARKHAG